MSHHLDPKKDKIANLRKKQTTAEGHETEQKLLKVQVKHINPEFSLLSCYLTAVTPKPLDLTAIHSQNFQKQKHLVIFTPYGACMQFLIVHLKQHFVF